MALNNNREFYFVWLNRIFWFALVAGVVIYNIIRFMSYLQINPQKTIEYTMPVDEYADFRSPLVAGVFVPSKNSVQKVSHVVLPNTGLKHLNGADLKFLKRVMENPTAIYVIYEGDAPRLWSKGKGQILEISVDNNDRFKRLHHILKSYYQQTKISYLQYSKTASKDLLEKVFSQQSPTLFIWLEDYAQDQTSAGKEVLNSILLKENLRPKLFDLLKNKPINITNRANGKSIKELPLEEQAKNLKQYVNQNAEQLKKLYNCAASGKIVSSSDNGDYDYLSDRAAVLALTYDSEKNKYESYGTTDFDKSLQQNVYDVFAKVKEVCQNCSTRLFLLTDNIELRGSSEEEIVRQITPGTGLILRYGERNGVLLPLMWELYTDKKEIIKQLKVKSGLSPDYWSEQIKIYYFRAVEIPKK